MAGYQKILVETYLAIGETSRSAVRVRPVLGQPFAQTMNVECSKHMRFEHPLGTWFEIEVIVKQKAGGEPFLYSPWQWPYSVLSKSQVNIYKRKLAAKNGRPAHRSKQQPGYLAKIPFMRDWLINVARAQETVTYGDVMAVFDVDRFSLRHALGQLGDEARSRGEPIITALVVNKKTGLCSSGLRTAFGVPDDRRERRKLFEYWTEHKGAQPALDATTSVDLRALQFAITAARPEQSRFRRLVFVACGGKCIVTGCSIPEALDAAHKRGRDWRSGHNGAEDGWLLRKDLHALYDAKLLEINDDGSIKASQPVEKHYPDLPAWNEQRRRTTPAT
jgi:hypothetical protein